MLSLTPEAARLNNEDQKSNVYLPERYGALVLRVGPDSPASRAGFRRFDLITEISGTAIESAVDAQDLVDKAPVPSHLTTANHLLAHGAHTPTHPALEAKTHGDTYDSHPLRTPPLSDFVLYYGPVLPLHPARLSPPTVADTQLHAHARRIAPLASKSSGKLLHGLTLHQPCSPTRPAPPKHLLP
jgi:hypothetical protein